MTQFHSFGYEGRCALPSHFDCSYSYTLGYTAAALIAKGHCGLMASVQNVQVSARASALWVQCVVVAAADGTSGSVLQ
jgi:6-phosphofructokinase